MRNSALSIAIVELMLIQNVVQLTLHLGDELFQMVGKIIVLSILHGRPAPMFFACSVID